MSQHSARLLTTRLAITFSSMSIVLALSLWFFITEAILWAEDSVTLRHLQVNRDFAVGRYITGAQGPIKMDNITTAFNDRSQLPTFLPEEIRNATKLLSEVELDHGEYFVLIDQYQYLGSTKQIYLISSSNSIELTEQESTVLSIVIFAFTGTLLGVLGIVLIRLSKRLIEPIYTLNNQLKLHRGDPEIEFKLPESATSEFQGLVTQLNHYRAETHRLLQREQAFARYTSHELRTPLTIIKGANSLLGANTDIKFQQRQSQRIANASNQMEETVEALLSLVRNERHDKLEPWRQINKDELEQLIENNRPPALGNPVEINLNVLGSPKVRASKPLLAMVFGNLLRNAIGASISGNIAVEMTEELLFIDDDGNGLGEKSKDGHGLGLMIVTDVCQRYGWKFSLTDLANGGCRAQISFHI
ncbi:sensor histidine kinase [Ferrimonas lipolytica]|uniref:histidine kinase n=1 Tax=Ferrimonas lipolytica TaxID=2724191 RepID=A0A6H1UAV5_9GAMM|nr:HAMP domain-containing sensor histidine kinase [Ferrimonas lipolytica]QIZ75968.1 HAMP domain-containing histidine kinase [Ferrimonas lipolytica]